MNKMGLETSDFLVRHMSGIGSLRFVEISQQYPFGFLDSLYGESPIKYTSWQMYVKS